MKHETFYRHTIGTSDDKSSKLKSGESWYVYLQMTKGSIQVSDDLSSNIASNRRMSYC